MGLLILFFLVSIVFSFLCSIWEAVLLSINPSTVEIKHQEGGRVGVLLKGFKENIDRPLAAILTLNTIAHTVGAIGVGAQATKIWGESLMAGVVIPVAMTLAILILSEIIPKTLGANYWKTLTNFTVRSIQIVIIALFPLVWLSQLITKVLKKNKSESVLSRGDISAMARIGAKEGELEHSESKIIQNLLRFDTIRTKDIMTPRTVVKAAPEEQTIQEFFEMHKGLRFSRIPIYEDNIDNISGFVLKDEVLTKIIEKQGHIPLKELRRNLLIVPTSVQLPDLFNMLMERREHIALVVDDFGGMAGLVTMEDVIETLLGMEIMDELDNIEDMQLLARKNWEKRAKNLGIISEENKKQ